MSVVEDLANRIMVEAGPLSPSQVEQLAAVLSDAHRATHDTHPRLVPRRGHLFVVRYYKGRRDVAHRYFKRPSDAARFARKLAARGTVAATFVTTTAWREVGR